MSSSKLIQSLMGTKPITKVASTEPGLTDPVYVEKLASAIDFIHDNYDSFGLDKTAAAYAPAHKAEDKAGHKASLMKALAKEKAAPAVDSKMADKVKASLAEGLKKKMKTKEADVAVQDDAVVQSVLAKLLRMRGEVEVPAEEKADEAPEPAQETESLPEEGEATEVKAASLADLSLADVLEGALRANELEEGVSKERSKTASVRGEKGPMARKAAVESLKQGLMAKFGKEA